jgi:hypothetical protein
LPQRIVYALEIPSSNNENYDDGDENNDFEDENDDYEDVDEGYEYNEHDIYDHGLVLEAVAGGRYKKS